jgi:hypothetical protein
MARDGLAIADVLWDAACQATLPEDLVQELDALTASEGFYPEAIRIPVEERRLRWVDGNRFERACYRRSLRYAVSLDLRNLYRDPRFGKPGTYRTFLIAAVTYVLADVGMSPPVPTTFKRTAMLTILHRKVNAERKKQTSAANVSSGNYKPPKEPKKRQVNTDPGARPNRISRLYGYK